MLFIIVLYYIIYYIINYFLILGYHNIKKQYANMHETNYKITLKVMISLENSIFYVLPTHTFPLTLIHAQYFHHMIVLILRQLPAYLFKIYILFLMLNIKLNNLI